MDEELYPEGYRKGDYIKGSNESVPEPFRVGRILAIFCKKSSGSKIANLGEIKVKVKVAKFQGELMLYRMGLIGVIFEVQE